jgi:ABC-2 type transport system permease protein
MKSIDVVNKELKIFFFQPMSYIITLLFLLLSGWFFASSLFIIRQAELTSLLTIMPFMLLFFVPAITMRLFAEELKLGTIEIVLTNPVKDSTLIAGKFMSALVVVIFMLIFTIYYTVALLIAGDPDIGKITASYIGLIFLISSYISIGIFASTLTKNQIVAFIVTFIIIFLLFMLDKITIFFPAQIQKIIEYLSITYHFNAFSSGLINFSDVIYYLTVIFLFLYLANYKLTKRYY